MTIQDEYTDRTDLTPIQKFNLRHPGRLNELHRLRMAKPENKIKALEYGKKWRSNPENKAKHKIACRLWISKNRKHVNSKQRDWRRQHPDYVMERQRKWRRKQKIKEIQRVNADTAKFINGSKSTIAKSRRNEILALHNRGKDIGSIAVWMNIPVSVISQVIQTYANPTTTP